MNGCDEPLPEGRGIRTVLGFEIRQCPRKDVPAHVAAWFGAYADGASETPYHEALHLAPSLVEAVLTIAATHHQIRIAEMEMKQKAKAHG